MREQKIKSLRPDLALEGPSKNVESFQNKVLRPILKFQNPLTLQYLLANKYFDADYNSLDNEKLQKKVTDLLNNTTFRNQLLGIVIGMMTEKEFLEYAENRKEYNKRIINMQLDRYMDQLL